MSGQCVNMDQDPPDVYIEREIEISHRDQVIISLIFGGVFLLANSDSRYWRNSLTHRRPLKTRTMPKRRES